MRTAYLGCVFLGTIHVIHVIKQNFDGLALQVELLVDLKCLLKHFISSSNLSHCWTVKVVQTVDVILDTSAISLY